MNLNDEFAKNADWKVALLRLTAFPQPGAVVNVSDWWEAIVGKLPENQTQQPRTNQITVSGEYEAGVLVLDVQPLRLHWRYEAVDPEELIDFIPMLGDLGTTTETFHLLMKRWFDIQNLPPMLRVAFGAVLVQQVDSRETAYKLLSQSLPFAIDTENTSDFLYQFNRRRYSKVQPSLEINRLAKWSAFVRTNTVLSPATHTIIERQIVNAARLEMDINTAADNEMPFDVDSAEALFSELIDLGLEIAREGDIP